MGRRHHRPRPAAPRRGGGWLWRDPRPPASRRCAIVGFLAGSVTLAAVSFVAGLTSRTASPVPVGAPAAVAVAVAPGCASSTSAGPFLAAPAGGRVDGFSVAGRRVLAYVPAAAASADAALPVVYFLHGSPGAAPDWTGSGALLPALLDRMRARGELPPLVAVFPDGNSAAGAWWGDTVDGAGLEGWFIDRLVPAVDRRFHTLGAARRGIAGVSAGGFGALNLALRHPGLFAWVASYSGVFAAPPDLFGRVALANSPAVTVASLPAARRFPLYVGSGADDSRYRGESDGLVRTLRGLGWSPLQAEVVPGGHGWGAWAVELRDSLGWVGRLWSADPAIAAALPPTAVHGGC